ncbi:hypothetical protein [Paractinoplanes atraurantiacus]|uniref:hypothetical protein n=1 Tax=Paractinoplanes atraurantiacus TaxID=1036182 RepID=UPI000BE3C735|nr:hypothetical protein [Actinoplanes atraurantiacus]
MNILSQIVPGLRDARTPFSVGLIWAITGWLAASLLPSAVWDKTIFADASTQIAKLPTEVTISVAVFFVYVAGILLNAALGAIRALVMFAAGLAGVVLVLVVMLAVARFFLVYVFCALMIVALWALLRWKRLATGTYWSSLEDCLGTVFRVIAGKADQAYAHMRHAYEADSPIFDELVDQELELYFDRNPEFLPDAVAKLSRKALYQTSNAVGVTLADVHAVADPHQRQRFQALRNLDDLHLSRRKSADHADDDLRQVLREHLSNSADARRAFARSALDYSELRGILRRRLERAELVLRSEKPDVFMDYDRVRAEGELRAAVGLPVAALLAIAAYKWHLVFHADKSMTPFYWLCGGAILIGVVLHGTGESLIKKSNRMLYISVRTELITIKQDEGFNEGVFVFSERPAGLARTSIARFVVRQATREATERIASRILPKYGHAYRTTEPTHADRESRASALPTTESEPQYDRT